MFLVERTVKCWNKFPKEVFKNDLTNSHDCFGTGEGLAASFPEGQLST